MDYDFERSQYDLKTFLESIKDKDYPEILDLADKEIYRVEQLSSDRPGAVRSRQLGSVKYASKLKEFLYYMRSGGKPASVNNYDFKLYKMVVQSLVDKGQRKPEALEDFE